MDITRDIFEEQRNPRFGKSNPELMNLAFWEWMIRSPADPPREEDRLSDAFGLVMRQGRLKSTHGPWKARDYFGIPLNPEDGPIWTFHERMGTTRTELGDGRTIFIAGEHEDSYDPDFYIYNDVIVFGPGDQLDIYGNPKDVFPPTDFHTTTLIGDRLIIIGCLGHPEDREPGSTPVFSLDTHTFAMRRLATSGEMPGWIHDHRAALSDDENSILVTGGKIDRGADYFLIENISDWRLSLKGGIWECVTHRSWPRWEISRPDRRGNYLWEIRQALWNLEVGREADYAKALLDLTDALGKEPDVKSVEKLYRPDMPHDSLPKREEEYGIHRIRVDGVTVRYVEEHHCVHITVEGELPELTIRQLVEDVRSKLSSLENTEYHAAEIA